MDAMLRRGPNPSHRAHPCVRAKSDTYFARLLQRTGGVNRWHHDRQPAAVDAQTVIRQNRDTLYSSAIVDISAGATLTLPETSGRYQTAMIVNQDHYINRVFDQPGSYALTVAEFDTPYVLVAVRTLVDPTDADDVRDRQCRAGPADGRGAVGHAVDPSRLRPGEPGRDPRGAAGAEPRRDRLPRRLRRQAADRPDHPPHRHGQWLGRIARGAGVLSQCRAAAAGGACAAMAPVRAFWSISVYNQAGYFEPNALGRYTVNSVTAARNADGTVTVNFGGDASLPNQIPIMEGWNYAVRLYRPQTRRSWTARGRFPPSTRPRRWTRTDDLISTGLRHSRPPPPAPPRGDPPAARAPCHSGAGPRRHRAQRHSACPRRRSWPSGRAAPGQPATPGARPPSGPPAAGRARRPQTAACGVGGRGGCGRRRLRRRPGPLPARHPGGSSGAPAPTREQLAAEAMGGQPGKQPRAVADGVLGVEILADCLQLSRCLLGELGRQDEVGQRLRGRGPGGSSDQRQRRVDTHQQHRTLSGNS